MEVCSNFIAVPTLSLIFNVLPTNFIQTLLEIPTRWNFLAEDEVILEGFTWTLLKLLAEISGIQSAD
jgi:hypothetical protein